MANKKSFLIGLFFLLIFLFNNLFAQPAKNNSATISKNKKTFKIAIKVKASQSQFELKNEQINKVKIHVVEHYERRKDVSPLPENQSDSLFKYFYSSGDTIKLMESGEIEFCFTCDLGLVTNNQQEPDSSIIRIGMTLSIFKKNLLNKKRIENHYVVAGDRLGRYFPAKIDAGLVYFDSIINSHLEKKISRGEVIIGIVTIGLWRLVEEFIFKTPERKKLPDVPGFPR